MSRTLHLIPLAAVAMAPHWHKRIVEFILFDTGILGRAEFHITDIDMWIEVALGIKQPGETVPR